MNSHVMRLRLLALTLSLVLSLVSIGAVSAQQGGNIYAAADLTPEGASSEGSASTATFEHVDSGGTQVTVVLMNMQPLTEYKVEIRDGGCGGPVLFPLQTIQTDDKGGGNAATQVQAEVEFGRWYVGVYSGGDAAVLCGQVNPALAGAPPVPAVDQPGMPGTGRPADGSLVWWVAILAGVAVLGVSGTLVLRYSHVRQHDQG